MILHIKFIDKQTYLDRQKALLFNLKKIIFFKNLS
jgi:hypothetical protein